MANSILRRWYHLWVLHLQNSSNKARSVWSTKTSKALHQSPKKTENLREGPILDSSADRYLCLIVNWKGSVPIPEQSFETRE